MHRFNTAAWEHAITCRDSVSWEHAITCRNSLVYEHATTCRDSSVYEHAITCRDSRVWEHACQWHLTETWSFVTWESQNWDSSGKQVQIFEPKASQTLQFLGVYTEYFHTACISLFFFSFCFSISTQKVSDFKILHISNIRFSDERWSTIQAWLSACHLPHLCEGDQNSFYKESLQRQHLLGPGMY